MLTVHDHAGTQARVQPYVKVTPHPTRHGGWSGAMSILGASVLWGTTGTVSALARLEVAPAVVGATSLILGGLLLFGTHRAAWSLPAICAPFERVLLLIGACTVAAYPLAFYSAVAHAGVAVSTVLALGSAPIFASMLAVVCGGACLSPRLMIVTAVAILGCVLLVLGPSPLQSVTATHAVGAGLALLAGFAYAIYSFISGRLIVQGYASGAVMGILFGGASLASLPVLLSADMEWLLTLQGISVVCYLALFATFLAYCLFGRGLRYKSAHAATVLTLAEPTVASILSFTILGERLTVTALCGLALLVLSLLFMTLQRPE